MATGRGSPVMVKLHPDILMAYRKLERQVGNVMEKGRNRGFGDYAISEPLLAELKLMNMLWQELQVVVSNHPMIDQPKDFYGRKGS